MILRLLICFSAWQAFTIGAAVHGTIQIVQASDKGTRARELPDTIVWLEPAHREAVPKPKAERARIDQRRKKFIPHVLVIPVGSSIDFPNSDPIFHNAFSNFDGEVFDIGLYPPGSSRRVEFRREGIVRVFCNIHSSMSAIVAVLSSPYTAVSAADGTFTISNVLPGGYRLMIFNEQATQESLNSQAREVEIGMAPFELNTLTLTGNGSLITPHLNKFGKPYPPVSEDGSYAGAHH